MDKCKLQISGWKTKKQGSGCRSLEDFFCGFFVVYFFLQQSEVSRVEEPIHDAKWFLTTVINDMSIF